jgi:hypothetical protein
MTERLVATLTLHDDGRVSGLWRPVEVELPARTPAELVAGTWALQQVLDLADLDRLRPSIMTALGTPGLRGFSARFPLRAVFDGDNFLPELVEAAKALADEAGVAFSWRTMAGRHTPAAVLDSVRTYADSAGVRFPAPFETDGTPARRFCDALADFAEPAAAWSRAADVALLHLPWFGHDWAELWHGTDVRGLAGYSLDAFVAGHAALWDVAWSVAGADLMVELPLSGHGPLAGPDGVSNRLAEHMAAAGGPAAAQLCSIQANGWGCILTGVAPPDNVGLFGNPDPAQEAAFSEVWTHPLVHGMQAIQPQDYGNWADMFAAAEAEHALYVEVYVGPSFTGPGAGDLAAQVLTFAPTLPNGTTNGTT